MRTKGLKILIIAVTAFVCIFIRWYEWYFHKRYYLKHIMSNEYGLRMYCYNNIEYTGDPIYISLIKQPLIKDISDLDRICGCKEDVGIIWEGVLNIPISGFYKFKIRSDDGSRFYLNGALLIKNDGIHPSKEISIRRYFWRGDYPIEIRYFQANGEAEIKFMWRPPKLLRDLQGEVPSCYLKPVDLGFDKEIVNKIRVSLQRWDIIIKITVSILIIYIINLCILFLKKWITKLPYELRYAFLLFIITRLVLTVIGVCSRVLLSVFVERPVWMFTGTFSKLLWLDIWGVWDTGWYIRIAEMGYPSSMSGRGGEYGFFPLYSLLMRGLNLITHNSYISGLIISNLSLILSCVLLYKLVTLDSDVKTGIRSIKYLFLFPSAFILSGVFSESLFLTLAILTFYYARKGKWLYVGIAGFFLSLTRSTGVFIFLPILFEYLRMEGFRLKNIIGLRLLYLFLIPLGIFVFGLFSYLKTGNFFAYVISKQTRFRMSFDNPLNTLYLCFESGSVELVFNSLFCTIGISLLTLFYRKIGLSYWLYGIISLLVPLLYGKGPGEQVQPVVGAMTGMLRFSLVIFPFYILFARLSENDIWDLILTLIFAILQGFLMAFWCTGFRLVV